MSSKKNDDLFNQADGLSEQGRHTEAFEIFLRLAQDGNTYAMSRLAIIYCDGLGTKKDFDESIKWDLRAIDSGYIASMSNLALTLCQQRKFLEARNWFEKAVAAGDGDAALELAKLLQVSVLESNNVKFLLKSVIESNFVTQASVEEARALLDQIERTDN
jgi:TPR repeat protein